MNKMKSPLSPSDIEVLIWCHCRPEPHERLDAPAVSEAIRMFLDCGMVKLYEGKKDMYVTTKKGAALMRMLRNTPEPRLVWVDGFGSILQDAAS